MAGAKQFLVGNLAAAQLDTGRPVLPPAEQAALAQFTYDFNLGLNAEAASLPAPWA